MCAKAMRRSRGRPWYDHVREPTFPWPSRWRWRRRRWCLVMPALRGAPRLGFTAYKSREAAVRTSGKRAAKLEAAAKAVAQADESHGTYPPELLQQAKGRPSIDINDPRYDALWARTRETMGIYPIHTEGMHRIELILRVFDLNPTYGPCMGLTRLERWDRAKALGHDPPDEIRHILCTRQGVLDWQNSILD